MPGFSTPADLRRRALFFSQLGTMLGAGLTLVTGLRTLAGPRASTPEQRLAAGWLDGLGMGWSPGEALARLPSTEISALDLALVRAGEQSGSMDRAMALLARHHHAMADNLASVLQSSVYPLLVLHLTAFVAPLPALVRTGDLLAYGARSVGVLVLLHGLALAVAWALRPGRPWRPLAERALLRVPLLGRARADLALARLAWSLEAMLSAGVLVTEAWPLAARASGSTAMERAVERWRDDWKSGATPAELVALAGVFPDAFVGGYAAGEASGRLEAELARLARHHEEEGFRGIRLFSMWCPRVLYGLVSAWVALEILSIATSYLSVVGDLLGE